MLGKLVQTAAFRWALAFGGIAAAALGPWGFSSASQWWSALNSGSSAKPAAQQGDSLAASLASPLADPGGQTPHGTPAPARAVSIPLEDILRFDITIREVLARWPRVSTGLAELQLQGYRVALVTGTAETDLAGALTYYFNPTQQVQRIAFQGTTGDGRELVRVLTTRFGFQRRLTNDPSAFVYEAPALGGQAQSVLRMKMAPLLKADRPHQRFDVSLVLQRPAEKEESLVTRILGERGT